MAFYVHPFLCTPLSWAVLDASCELQFKEDLVTSVKWRHRFWNTQHTQYQHDRIVKPIQIPKLHIIWRKFVHYKIVMDPPSTPHTLCESFQISPCNGLSNSRCNAISFYHQQLFILSSSKYSAAQFSTEWIFQMLACHGGLNVNLMRCNVLLCISHIF